MFSKKEKEYLIDSTNFNSDYSRVLNCRIRKKIRNVINDLILFVQLKTTFDTTKYNREILRILNDIKKFYPIKK